jgi:CubicO group peptidase (beta-lactamase class C family)
MKPRGRTPVLVLFLLAAVLATQSLFPQAGARTFDIKSIKGKVEKVLNERTAKGFSGSVLISIDDKVIFSKGFGFTDAAKKHKVTPGTLFNVASITKTFAALGILILKERGLIRLENKIGIYFKGVPPDKKEITLHHLLTHTTGLQQHYVTMEVADRETAVRNILNDKLAFETGTQFRYSNENYQLLAAIIEIVSGKSYEAFTRTEILTKAGMKNTRFWGEFDDRDARFVGQKIRKLSPKYRQRNWDQLGSGGIYSTSMDLFKFYRALKAHKLISAQSFQLALRPHREITSTRVGYGWFINETERKTREYWTRGTEDFGHNAVLRWFPDENVVIIVCSNAGRKLGNYANQLIGRDMVRIIFGSIKN